MDGFVSCRSRYHLRFGLGPGPISLAPVLQGAEGGFAEHLRATKPLFFCQKQGRAKAPEKEKKKNNKQQLRQQPGSQA